MENNNNKFSWSDKELSNLKERVIKRVNFAWFMRKVLIPASSAIAVSGIVLYYAIKSRNVAVIEHNISARLFSFDFAGLAHYLIVAVQKTQWDVLAISVSSTLLALYFGRKLIRETMSYLSRPGSLILSPKSIK